MTALLTLRGQVDRPLTFSEIDGNFTALRDFAEEINLRIITTQGEGIETITLQNGTITFHGTKSTNWGPFELPVATPNPRGDWEADTSYNKNDIILAPDGAGYICTEDHLSPEDFDPDRWVKIAEKGAEGPEGPTGTYLIRSQEYNNGAINIDATSTDLAVINLGANATTLALTGTPQDGQGLKIKVIQDQTGGRALSFNLSNINQGDILMPANPAQAANKISYYLFIYNQAQSKWDFIAYSGGF